MTLGGESSATFTFDAPTRAIVRLAARIAAGSESEVRDALRETVSAQTPEVWVEEVVLQSHLFSGFPRALNAAREWRKIYDGKGKGQGVVQGTGEGGYDVYREQGERTCAAVYGRFYSKLRSNIVDLHPELDRWMIVEGYGKVLSRPGLDLGRRELCIVAACAASGQDRQLHSHLHGARNVGVPDDAIGAALDALEGAVDTANLERAVALWTKVRGQ
jgi:4-carboxymuconolactone decarboxylase